MKGTAQKIREKYGINHKQQQAINYAIRREIPGGNAALDLLKLCHELQRHQPNDKHNEALRLAREVADAMSSEIESRYRNERSSDGAGREI